MNLSKSRYVLGKRCNKLLWLSCYKKELAEDSGNEAVLENGNRVGDLARSLFGDYVLIEFNSENMSKMIEDTKIQLKNKPNIICEASFSYKNNFCSVDILKNDTDGVEIYEVKSSTEVHDYYLDDISYQTCVLKKCGLNVKKSYLVYINNQYVFKDKLDLNKLFIIEDVTDITLSKEKDVIKSVEVLDKIINSKDEPNDDLNINCNNSKCRPKECPFFKYCTRELVSPNVFDVGWGVHFDKKLKLYNENKITFNDVLLDGSLNSKANTQIDFYLHDQKPKIDVLAIKSLFDKFTYPLYFLDFESYQPSIPSINGTRPYQQICFQYSLHIMDENGKLTHREYLSEDYDGNPMYGLCKRLCEDIPLDSCTLAYHKSFECSRLNEMAELFPEFSKHLLNISKHIIDLEIPFAHQDYYIKEMEGRSSIKVVLPALYPNEKSLDYHNLNQVHKGDEASAAYLSLKDLNEKDRKELRKDMLEYCKLDTYAMVKLYEKLKDVI